MCSSDLQLANPERDRKRGIGLGLAIVRRLTDLLRIKLELESDLGRGTTFRLALPRAQDRRATAREPLAAAAPEVPLPEGLVVLVVDDERSVREGMCTLLEAWGCRVLLASGTDEALATLGAAKPDLIVADHRLRGRETGITLLQRAREVAGDVPALLITGDTAAEVLDHAQRLGLTLLHKPVHEQALRSAMAEAVKTQVR